MGAERGHTPPYPGREPGNSLRLREGRISVFPCPSARRDPQLPSTECAHLSTVVQPCPRMYIGHVLDRCVFRPWEGGKMARTLEEGLHLGYRKPRSGAGKWVARFYDGGQAYTVETIAIADDLSDANDATVLSFDQAQKKARKLRDERDRS